MIEDIEAFEKLRQRTLGPLKKKTEDAESYEKIKARMLSPMET